MTMHHHDTHPADERFHDLVDGRLAPDERAGVEAHLAACDACARRVARLRSLVAMAGALPRELAPPRDGWPPLRGALAGRAAERSRAAHARRGAWLRLPAALAAAALLAVTSWNVARRVADSGATATVAATPPSAGATPTYAGVERDYARAAAELTAQLEATRGQLSPSAAAAVDRSLATIDGALAEARAALRADPANPEVARFLTASYEQKLDLLRRSTAITSGD